MICSADSTKAWISANNAGTYHIDKLCQQLGYVGYDGWDGTYGSVCG